MHTPPQKQMVGRLNKMEDFARRPSRRSSALIITLVALSMLVVMTIALSFIVRVDRISSKYFLEDTRAALFSDQGVNHAVALLRSVTGNASSYWVVQPGQAYVPSGGGTQSPSVAVPLNSGYARPDDTTQPNLNVANFTDPNNYAIDPYTIKDDAGNDKIPKMRAQWIYVDQGGHYSILPPASPVGRYAFWVDNENSRINLNTAFQAGSNPTNDLAPNNIEMTYLPGLASTNTGTIHNYVTATPLNSPDGARLINPTDANLIATMNTNKFSTTYYNHDPSPFLTYWGAPKIVLTTQKRYATLPNGNVLPYLDIFNGPAYENTDPGYADIDELSGGGSPNLSSAGINTAMTNIDTYLMRTDSPAAPKSNLMASFGSKFFSNGQPPSSSQASMLAMNIIEYVRCKESAHTFVDPIFGTSTASGGYDEAVWGGNGYGGGFSNHTRRLDITEMGIWVAADPLPPPPPVPAPSTFPLWTFPSYYVLEIYWPKNDPNTNPPTAAYNLANLVFTIQYTQLWYDYPPGSGTIQFLSGNSPGIGFPLGSSISPGQYRTVCIPFSIPVIGVAATAANPTGKPNRPASGDPNQPLYLRTWIWDGTRPVTNYNPLAEAGVEYQGPGMIKYVLDPATAPPNSDTFDISSATTYNGISSVHTAEPSQSQGAANWTQGPNTFGRANGASIVGSPAIFSNNIPEQDTDEAGNITDASFTLPDPVGTGNNPLGYITSLTELGHVDTGNAGDTGPAGVLYRTLHLQPMKYKGPADKPFLPDWAILDNFITPAEVMSLSAQGNVLPTSTAYTNLVSGRINLNSQVQPYGADDPPLTRPAPLQGLTINGTNTLDIPTITSNIYYHVVSPTYGQTYSSAGTNVYTMPGEIAEIKGIADTGEASEANLQNLLGLATTQSDVFRIYSIGQSIQMDPNGQVIVTGEHRDMTLVERYLNPDPNNAGGVSFRTIYHRSITF